MSIVEWFWTGPANPRHGATATLGTRLDGDRVIIGFGGWGIKEEDLPCSPEEIKDFHRAVPFAPGGKPAPEWYCELVDTLSADGGWEASKYETYHISGCSPWFFDPLSFSISPSSLKTLARSSSTIKPRTYLRTLLLLAILS